MKNSILVLLFCLGLASCLRKDPIPDRTDSTQPKAVQGRMEPEESIQTPNGYVDYAIFKDKKTGVRYFVVGNNCGLAVTPLIEPSADNNKYSH